LLLDKNSSPCSLLKKSTSFRNLILKFYIKYLSIKIPADHKTTGIDLVFFTTNLWAPSIKGCYKLANIEKVEYPITIQIRQRVFRSVRSVKRRNIEKTQFAIWLCQICCVTLKAE